MSQSCSLHTRKENSCLMDEQKMGDTAAQWFVLLPHSNKVIGMNSPFCKEFACSPGALASSHSLTWCLSICTEWLSVHDTPYCSYHPVFACMGSEPPWSSTDKCIEKIDDGWNRVMKCWASGNVIPLVESPGSKVTGIHPSELFHGNYWLTDRQMDEPTPPSLWLVC